MEVSVYFTEFDEINAGGFDFQNDRFFSLCPEQIQQSIIRFRQATDRMASYLGKRLLAQAITDYGFASECLNDYSLDEFKRPFISNNFDFNISHSGNWVALIASDSSRVGIDIEKKVDLEIEEYRSCFTDEEWNEIVSSDDTLGHFFKFWTKKESILKCYGTGLLREPNTISVIGNEVIIDEKPYSCREIFLKNGFIGFVACDTRIDSVRLIDLSNKWL